MKRHLLSAAALGAVMAAMPAQAQQTFELQSVFGLQVPSIGPSPQLWADRVNAMTGGEITVNVHGAGDFVPPFEVFGAVSSGALDMGFDWIGYWADSIPVANLVGSMPFGPSPEVAMGWMFEGGGLEIIQRAYDPHNVKVLPCHLVVPEAGGFFNQEINAPEDFEGLTMRIAGLGGQAVAELGANVQMIPAGEIYLALETGRIDAAEFSAPQLDVGFGFQDISDYYYFPGWHQPSSWDSIIINMDVWNSISEENQHLMEQACLANIAYNMHNQIHEQAPAIEAIREAGTEVRRFPDEVLDALRDASHKVMAEAAEEDEIFAEALESLYDYMESVGEWEELQVLPR